MAQGRSLLREMFKNFVKSLKPRNTWGKLIGKDNMGTHYYEAPGVNGKRSSRWFLPQDGKSFDIEKPPEWETWLRHVRKNPPTEEEIILNLQKKMAAVANAEKLEKSRRHDADMKTFVKPSFPVYEEYNSGFNEQKKDQQ